MFDFLKNLLFNAMDLNPFHLDVINFYLFIIMGIFLIIQFVKIGNLQKEVLKVENGLGAINACMERKEKYKLERRLWALEEAQRQRAPIFKSNNGI